MKKLNNVFQLQELAYRKVMLKDAMLQRAFELETSYLDKLDADRLLAGFLETAGLPAAAERYPGWEQTEIQGHTLGHYLTAVCQCYAQTGEQKYIELIRHILGQLKKSQAEDGYLFASHVELFDRVEQKKPAWVPWYTMHKILEGLVAACEYTQEPLAYEVAKKLGDWIYWRTQSWSEETRKTVLAVEYGGMNDCLYDLYLLTGEERYAKAAHAFDEEPLFEALYEKKDILNGLHANTTIPKIVGAVKRYIALGETQQFYLQAAENFWDIVLEHHTYVTGGNSEWEHFGEPDILDGERTACNCETCNSYNMLKLTKYLFLLTGKQKYAAFYEKAFINSILSSQNPATGMTTYFQPMATGFFKVYGTPFDKFWCCTGTGMENFTKLTEGIYYQKGNRLYISRYVSSCVTWEETGRRVEVTADLLEEEQIRIRISRLQKEAAPAEYDEIELAVRIPDWLKQAPNISFKHGNISCQEENGFLILSGDLGDGQEIVVTLPMKLMVHTLPDNENVVAFTYGPYVLSAGLGKQMMDMTTTGVDVLVPKKELLIQDYLVLKQISSQELKEKIEQYLIRQDGKLAFLLEGIEGTKRLLFTPHFLRYDERYGIYWRLYQKESKELLRHREDELQRERLQRTQLDTIPIGNDQYELAHGIRGEKTDTARVQGIRCRFAKEDGWFSYVLYAGTQGRALCVTYCAQDNGSSFDIYLNNQLYVQETLDYSGMEPFYSKAYPLEVHNLDEQGRIKVTFRNKNKEKECRIFKELYVKKE